MKSIEELLQSVTEGIIALLESIRVEVQDLAVRRVDEKELRTLVFVCDTAHKEEKALESINEMFSGMDIRNNYVDSITQKGCAGCAYIISFGYGSREELRAFHCQSVFDMLMVSVSSCPPIDTEIQDGALVGDMYPEREEAVNRLIESKLLPISLVQRDISDEQAHEDALKNIEGVKATMRDMLSVFQIPEAVVEKLSSHCITEDNLTNAVKSYNAHSGTVVVPLEGFELNRSWVVDVVA